METLIDTKDWSALKTLLDHLASQKIKIRYYKKCDYCGILLDSQITVRFFSCLHYHCLDCLAALIADQYSPQNFSCFYCRICLKGVAPLRLILKFQLPINSENQSPPHSITKIVHHYFNDYYVSCAICEKRVHDTSDYMVGEQCLDLMCGKCVRREIQTALQNQKQIKAPCPCKCKIQQIVMKKLLPPHQYQKAVDHINLSPILADDDFIECENVKCQVKGFGFSKSKILITAECYGCLTPHCVKCKRIHQGKRHVCGKPPIHEDPLIRQMIEGGEAKQCPVCYSVIVKQEQGECWFMYCNSQRCAEKTCFCFICGDQLDTTDDKHIKHFPRYQEEYLCLHQI